MSTFLIGNGINKFVIYGDGKILSINEILMLLRQGDQDKKDAERYRKLRVKNWSEGGITIVEKAASIKLGEVCLSHELLDEALDAE